jgi:hypothetical protein
MVASSALKSPGYSETSASVPRGTGLRTGVGHAALARRRKCEAAGTRRPQRLHDAKLPAASLACQIQNRLFQATRPR